MAGTAASTAPTRDLRAEATDPAADAGGPDASFAPLRAPLPAALPVALALRERFADTVRRTVEGQLGWQPVDEATASLVPPAVRLTDVAAAPGDATPTILLVAPEDAPLAAAAATARLRPAAVIAWPDDEGHLVDAVAVATATPRRTEVDAATVRVGGAAGGVGTTTVALALAGLAAWRGRSTLIASGDRLLLPERTPTIDPAALAAPDLWSRAVALTGVPGARAVRTTSPPFEPMLADAAVDVAVLDLGVADEVDVLVCRPDAFGAEGLERTTAAAVVVVGHGPVPARALAAAAGGRRRVDLPWSARVARAAVVGRVPAALPGRLVRSLLPLVPAGGPSG